MTQFIRYDLEYVSALYKDGALVISGDPFYVTEHLDNLLKVEKRDSDEIFLGKEQKKSNIAREISEIADYAHEAAKRAEQVALVKKANDLLIEGINSGDKELSIELLQQAQELIKESYSDDSSVTIASDKS